MTEDERTEKAIQMFQDISLNNHLSKQTNAAKTMSPYCDECATLIPIKRHKAIANCRLCVDCQNEIEKRHRMYS